MTRMSQNFYATVWRWHFYAGLFVAPFLVVLAITGAIYLFNTEINDALYPELSFASSEDPSLPPGRLIAAAESAFPGGQVTRIDMPTEAGRTAQLFLTAADGEALRVFVDPATASVLGSYVYTETLVGFADVAHGSLMLGDAGDAVVELAASWALILVCSGLYLWFPRPSRGQGRGMWLPKLNLKGRRLWREAHQATGLYTAILIAFLILSGLPWATIWGDQVLAPVSDTLGLGYPDGARRGLQSALPTVADLDEEAPWTLRQAPAPISGGADNCGTSAEVGPGCHAIGVDEAARILAEAGMTEAYRLSLPRGAEGAYMAYTYPDRPQGQRTLQVDQYSGGILADVRFDDYGAVARVVELGVALHMGNYFGLANQLVLLLPCLGILALVVSGVAMWWKRRPKGRLGAPAGTPGRALPGGIMVAIVALGLFLPLAGLSMVAVWVGERIVSGVQRRWALSG